MRDDVPENVSPWDTALFGVNKNSVIVFKNRNAYATDNQQLKFLQEECRELIESITTAQLTRETSSTCDKRAVEDWYKDRNHLIASLSYVALLSAVVGEILCISQEEINNALSAVILVKEENNNDN